MPERREPLRSYAASAGREDPYADLPRRTRARKAIGDPGGPRPAVLAGQRRRLTDEERRVIRERRQAVFTPAERANVDPGPVSPEGQERRSRSERAASRRVGGRVLALGTLLFVSMTVVAAGAGGVFDRGERREPEPTAPALAAIASPEAELAAAAGPVASPASVPPADDVPVVCLDPGHGGDDTGYTREPGGGLPFMAEADYNLAHALDLAGRLRARGITVILTRRTPNAVNASGADVNGDGESLTTAPRPGYAADVEAKRIKRAGEIDEQQARINVCNAAGADLLVSMHLNGYDRPSPTAKGYETWYTGVRPFGDRNQRFATLVYRSLGEHFAAAGFETLAREVNDDEKIDVDANDPGFFDHMIMTGPDVPGAITASQMPGAIVEALFISDDGDARFLASEQGHDAVVSAYEEAILAYLEEFPG